MTITFNGSSSSSSCSGISNIVINNAGHLIVTYNDNTIEDLGLVVGTDGADGTNFYPNAVGFDIPDGTYELSQPLGWTYLSLTAPVTLYFKTTAADVTPSTWATAPFGVGQTGATGQPFHIDSTGTTFPTTGLTSYYTFYKTDEGSIYQWNTTTSSWNGPYKFKGDTGLQGRFIIDLSDDTFPDITSLSPGYTFYNTETGYLYYVIQDSTTSVKSWSPGIEFRGPQGIQGDKGLKGDAGSDANNIFAVKNIIDTSYTNALLVIGTCPAGYIVSNIEVDVTTAYVNPVTDLKVRFGGTAQSEIDGTIIADSDYFDINTARRYIVNEVNHEVSTSDEILSCIFNESVNNSSTGNMTIIITLMKQLEITPIQNNI